MKSKFLPEKELKEFLSFCTNLNIKQKDMAEICSDHANHFSKAISNCRYRRAYARLIYLTKKEESEKDFNLDI